MQDEAAALIETPHSKKANSKSATIDHGESVEVAPLGSFRDKNLTGLNMNERNQTLEKTDE